VNFTGTTGANLGSSPQGPITLGTDTNYYGTTTTAEAAAALALSSNDFGRRADDAGELHRYHGAAPGSSPSGAVVQAADGNFYGTTSSGGATNFGTVFKVTPGGVFTSLANFTGTAGALLVRRPPADFSPDSTAACTASPLQADFTPRHGLPRRARWYRHLDLHLHRRGEGLTPNNGLVLASDNYLYGGDASPSIPESSTGRTRRARHERHRGQRHAQRLAHRNNYNGEVALNTASRLRTDWHVRAAIRAGIHRHAPERDDHRTASLSHLPLPGRGRHLRR